LILHCRFSHAAVKATLDEVMSELLKDKKYDPETCVELVKTVADDVQKKLQSS